MDFRTVSNDFHHAIQSYAYNRVPSTAGLANRLHEHFHYLPTYAYRALERATYAAAYALREYVDASSRLTDRQRAAGDLSEVEALWRVAGDREDEVHALIASQLGYDYEYLMETATI